MKTTTYFSIIIQASTLVIKLLIWLIYVSNNLIRFEKRNYIKMLMIALILQVHSLHELMGHTAAEDFSHHTIHSAVEVQISIIYKNRRKYL